MAVPGLTEIATTTLRNRTMPIGPTQTKAQKQKVVHTEMSKFKANDLHSGSKHGPIVKDRSQAIAIAMSESGQAAPKSVPAPASHSFPMAKNAHSYGHDATARSGHLRHSGHPSAHRIGKK